jgi:hypothetical protein
MDIAAIVLGITTSILAAILIYVFQSTIKVFVSSLFGFFYPNVTGSYRLKFLEQNDDEGVDTLVEIKQFANRITGTIKLYKKGKLVSDDILKGLITPTRVVKLQYESVSPEHHEHGAMLLKLSPDAKKLSGHVIFLCDSCENTGGR